MVRPASGVPDRGDVAWITLAPGGAHEQSGRRPAVVLSPAAYNAKVGLAVMVPITSRSKGYPFEVALPPGLPVEGVILSDQLRTLNWRARHLVVIGRLDEDRLAEVLGKVSALLFP